jgi:hypothetical protein
MSGGLARAAAERFFAALAGAEADRGWSYLSDIEREMAFRNDPARLVAAAEASDWTSFEWAFHDATGVPDLEGWYRVTFATTTPPEDLPAVIHDFNLAYPSCDGAVNGIGVSVGNHDGRTTVGPGALTGTAEGWRCN